MHFTQIASLCTHGNDDDDDDDDDNNNNNNNTPETVRERKDVTVLWNQGVHTDRQVMAKKILVFKREKTRILTDAANQRTGISRKRGQKRK